jgi:protein-tyrosine phosphatase
MPKKLIFVCHGNICRSPMAEFIMKDLLKKEGFEACFDVSSAATSREEIGNPVYPPARKKLKEHGIDCAGKTARQMTRADYDHYDMIICMESWNIRNSLRIIGSDPKHKLSLLLDYTDRKGEDISDPWYTSDFDKAWDDILFGCKGLLGSVLSNHIK